MQNGFLFIVGFSCVRAFDQRRGERARCPAASLNIMIFTRSRSTEQRHTSSYDVALLIRLLHGLLVAQSANQLVSAAALPSPLLYQPKRIFICPSSVPISVTLTTPVSSSLISTRLSSPWARALCEREILKHRVEDGNEHNTPPELPQ